MYRIVIISIVFLTSMIDFSYSQSLQEKFVVKMTNAGKSSNENIPFIFSTKSAVLDTLFFHNGKYATKKSMKFIKSNDLSSVKDLLTDIEYKELFPENKMAVDVAIKDDQLILLPRAGRFAQKLGSQNQISLDISKDVILRKESYSVGVVTIPFKVYLSNHSDSLSTFTNNIETNINIAFTVGKSWEDHAFNANQQSQLKSQHYLFGLVGANKLKLNEKNTAGSELVSDDVILSFSAGVGYQIGFNKLGFSFILGVDTPTSSLGDEWVYKNQLWLGAGIGYCISK